MLTSTSSSTSANHADAKQPRHKEKLRVAVVTENFLPKVDGVTRTLARLLEHFNSEGHEAIVFGPDTGLVSLLSSLLLSRTRRSDSSRVYLDLLRGPRRRRHIRPTLNHLPRPQAKLYASTLHPAPAAIQARRNPFRRPHLPRRPSPPLCPEMVAGRSVRRVVSYQLADVCDAVWIAVPREDDVEVDQELA
jgi:hypothetical protein